MREGLTAFVITNGYDQWREGGGFDCIASLHGAVDAAVIVGPDAALIARQAGDMRISFVETNWTSPVELEDSDHAWGLFISCGERLSWESRPLLRAALQDADSDSVLVSVAGSREHGELLCVKTPRVLRLGEPLLAINLDPFFLCDVSEPFDTLASISGAACLLEPKDVADQLKGHLDAHPGHLLHFRWAMSLTQLARLDEAESELEGLLHLLDPKHYLRPTVLRELASTRHQLGRTGSALALAREGLLDYPDYTDLAYLSGQCHLELGDRDAARACLRSCHLIGDCSDRYSSVVGVGSALAHEALGDDYYLDLQWARAAEEYVAGLGSGRVTRRALDRTVSLFATHAVTQELGELEGYLRQRMNLGGRTAEYMFASSLERAGKYQDAARCLRNVVKSPDAPREATRLLVRCLFLAGEATEAFSVLNSSAGEGDEALNVCQAMAGALRKWADEGTLDAKTRQWLLWCGRAWVEPVLEFVANYGGRTPVAGPLKPVESVPLAQLLELLDAALELRCAEAINAIVSSLPLADAPSYYMAAGKLLLKYGHAGPGLELLIKSIENSAADWEVFLHLAESCIERGAFGEVPNLLRTAVELGALPERLALTRARLHLHQARRVIVEGLTLYPESECLSLKQVEVEDLLKVLAGEPL